MLVGRRYAIAGAAVFVISPCKPGRKYLCKCPGEYGLEAMRWVEEGTEEQLLHAYPTLM